MTVMRYLNEVTTKMDPHRINFSFETTIDDDLEEMK